MGRQGMDNGHVKEYEIYLSADGQNWGQPVALGRLRDEDDEQRIHWPQPVAARYVKFVVLSEVKGRPIASAAEIDLLFAD